MPVGKRKCGRVRCLDRIPRWVSIVVLGVLGLGVWQGIVVPEVTSRILLPGPVETFGEIISTAGNIVTGGHVAEALWLTTQEVVLGFLAPGDVVRCEIEGLGAIENVCVGP